ncbi:type II 3-dehydroquinate dehydratase [Snodgrassella sp. B3882]|uniref:type II 3-dehydroquinate dehydratase n=1 Tax=Snodgrassella sp. B3882 TaxID=2818037 RepID=UPI00226A41E8|nr:type II 3-dehydroquinate dehydratase [Snodgrassella sp. B3882]MCX8744367.1 type II 3-dehydroquinate dehydratase [Snodgrassella sp. B3882]
MSASILVLNGPNLNLLGAREPHIYGHTTLADINQNLAHLSQAAGLSLETLQSNAEHVLIDRIQSALSDNTAFIIINPGAFTHSSIAIRDALSAAAKPFIEVHISNIHAREAFRHHSYLSDIALGVICGLGVYGYEAALCRAIQYIKENDHSF